VPSRRSSRPLPYLLLFRHGDRFAVEVAQEGVDRGGWDVGNEDGGRLEAPHLGVVKEPAQEGGGREDRPVAPDPAAHV